MYGILVFNNADSSDDELDLPVKNDMLRGFTKEIALYILDKTMIFYES